jgi:hypothetical protein
MLQVGEYSLRGSKALVMAIASGRIDFRYSQYLKHFIQAVGDGPGSVNLSVNCLVLMLFSVLVTSI